MESSPTTPLTRWQRFGDLIVTRPRAVVAGLLLLAALAGAGAGISLRVRPGYVDLLDRRSPSQARYLDLLEHFGNVESLHVIIESSAGATAASDATRDQFVDAFAREVRAARDEQGLPLAARVLDRVDPAWFVERLPALLPDEGLAALASSAAAGDLDLPALVSDPEPSRLLALISGSLDRMARQDAAAAAIEPSDLAVASSLLDALAEGARGEARPLGASLLRRGHHASQRLDDQGHVRLDAERILVTITPADTSNNHEVMAPFLAAVREAARIAKDESGADVRLSFTGAPALIVDEMQAVSRDVTLAALLSVALVTLLFFASFQSLRHVLFAGVANIAGLSLTFGAAWLLVGYLNLFSAVFAAVLAGLGIDFGIHLINQFEAKRRAGLPAREALRAVFGSTVPAIVASAITTAAAFLAILSSEFAGFAQLGLISGVGVMLCVLTSITLVPALLAWDAARPDAARRADPTRASGPWSEAFLLAIPPRAGRIALLGAALLLAALAALPGLRFDHDLMNLQPESSEAARLQRSPEHRVSTHRAFSLALDVNEANELSRRFSSLASVADVSSVASFLPPPSPQRQELLAQLAARVAPAGTRASPAGPVDLAETLAAVNALLSQLQELQDLAFEGGNAGAVDALETLLLSARELRAALDAPGAASGLTALRDRLRVDLQAIATALPALAAAPLDPRDLPPALAAHFVGRDGSLAVIVEPRESVWDRPALERFVAELRSVDPEITGPPVQVLEMTELMRVSLLRAAVIALAVIVLLVALSMRSVLGSALALLPLLLGFGLMLGAMSWLDIPLNPANLVALPLLLGIGVDGGIHLAHRWMDLRDSVALLREVGHPLLITSLTTVAGFLPLLLAHHQGIRSLGVVTCLGSLAMLLSAVILVPALLALFDEDAKRGAGAASRGAASP